MRNITLVPMDLPVGGPYQVAMQVTRMARLLVVRTLIRACLMSRVPMPIVNLHTVSVLPRYVVLVQ